MNSKSNMLLQDMQKAASCIYLSDLRTVKFNEQTKEIILAIPENSYSVEAWNAAASYVTNSKSAFSEVKEAKEAIVRLK